MLLNRRVSCFIFCIHSISLSRMFPLRLDGQALRVTHADGRKDHIPLHLLEQIVTFSYGTVTQHVMDACAERGIGLSFHTPKWQIPLPHSGRSTRKCTSASASIRFARRGTLPSGSVCIKRETAKLQSASEPHRRNHPTTGAGRLQAAENTLSQIEASLDTLQSEEALRSAEGQAARVYFSVFQDLILSDDRAFHFQGAQSPPPKRSL